MKICPVCHSQVGDESYYCTMCGNRLPDDLEPMPYQPQNVHSPFQQNPYQQPVYNQSVYNPYDHTVEFDPGDVRENKLYAMLMYLTSVVGIIIALLAAKDSAYVQFHLRQNVKLLIVEMLLALCAVVLMFTFIIPIAALIALMVVEIIRIIAFFQACRGKAKEPAIIRGLGFLK